MRTQMQHFLSKAATIVLTSAVVVSISASSAKQAHATVVVSGWTVIDDSFADDASGTYAEVGANWGPGAGGNVWGATRRFNGAGTGSETATWTFLGLDSGIYEVAVSYHFAANHATDAPFSINGGTPIDVNQTVATAGPPSLFDGANNILYTSLSSTVVVSSGTLTVVLTDDASNFNSADSVAIRKLSDLPTAPEPATAMLALFGVVGLVAGRRRRRR